MFPSESIQISVKTSRIQRLLVFSTWPRCCARSLELCLDLSHGLAIHLKGECHQRGLDGDDKVIVHFVAALKVLVLFGSGSVEVSATYYETPFPGIEC